MLLKLNTDKILVDEKNKLNYNKLFAAISATKKMKIILKQIVFKNFNTKIKTPYSKRKNETCQKSGHLSYL